MADRDEYYEYMVSDKYFILLEKSVGYILRQHVFNAPTKLLGEELQRGTILKEQPSDDPHMKTFIVADREEVYLDCELTDLEGLLDKLSADEATEQLLKISSPESRYKSYLHQHRRVGKQRQGEEEVSLCNVLLLDPNLK